MTFSTRTIWKFPLNGNSEQLLSMPAGARILTVQMQIPANALLLNAPPLVAVAAKPVLWVELDPRAPLSDRMIYCVMTGTELPAKPVVYINTVQNNGVVSHFYEGRIQ